MADRTSGPSPPAADPRDDRHGRRITGWLVGGALFAALFIAGIIINAVDESRGGPPDLQAVLVRADAQQVVVCGVLASAVAAHGTGTVTLNGPHAAADAADAAPVVLGAGQGPQRGIAAGTSVEVSATVKVGPGPGGAEVAALVDPTSIQVVPSCPAEIVPLSQ